LLFLSRAYDFIRMSVLAPAHLVLCGATPASHRGDGPSQMALEDLAMMRAW